MKKIKKSIDIKASAEKVWNALFNDDSFRIWCAVFSEGTFAETDWKQGSKVVFKDKSNSGIFGKIVKSIPNEALVIEYYGMIRDGAEDLESEEAKGIKGGIEAYALRENDGVTHLAIESDMDDKYFEMMSKSWDVALQTIKQLSEKAA